MASCKNGLGAMTRKRKRHKSDLDRKTVTAPRVVDAYQRHYGSTTQREDAAADLGWDLATFKVELNNARLLGFDIESRPRHPGRENS